MVIVGLWVLYYLSMGVYLTFYFAVLRPPSVPRLLQPLNLRYPDPSVHDYIYAYHCVSPVTYPQTYNWKLSLELPENPANFDAGVFMVSLALYPPDQLPTEPHEQVRNMFYRHLQGNVGNPSQEFENSATSVRIGSRPLMLRWRPAIYRWIQTIAFAVPRLLLEPILPSYFEETQHMEVNMIERHEAAKNATYATKQCFVVSINNPKVQIYKAEVEATVLMEGWRYLLYYWFWTFFLLGSLLLFFLFVSAIATYFIIRLGLAVIRGQVTLPTIWQSDEERQMKEMKNAVASLLHKKKLEAASQRKHEPIGAFEPELSRYSKNKADSTEERKKDDSMTTAVGKPKNKPISRKASYGSGEERKRPKSWLDEPIAESSDAGFKLADSSHVTKEKNAPTIVKREGEEGDDLFYMDEEATGKDEEEEETLLLSAESDSDSADSDHVGIHQFLLPKAESSTVTTVSPIEQSTETQHRLEGDRKEL